MIFWLATGLKIGGDKTLGEKLCFSTEGDCSQICERTDARRIAVDNLAVEQ